MCYESLLVLVDEVILIGVGMLSFTMCGSGEIRLRPHPSCLRKHLWFEMLLSHLCSDALRLLW